MGTSWKTNRYAKDKKRKEAKKKERSYRIFPGLEKASGSELISKEDYDVLYLGKPRL